MGRIIYFKKHTPLSYEAGPRAKGLGEATPFTNGTLFSSQGQIKE